MDANTNDLQPGGAGKDNTAVAAGGRPWNWTFTGPKGESRGQVPSAVDPRDALARLMTSELPSGKLFGDEHGIPVHILNEAPGNGDASLVVAGEGFRVEMAQVAD